MNSRPIPASRTLTVVLSESDWRALRNVEPDAVGWLHERIRERIGAVRGEPTAPAKASAATGSWGEDEY
jgi:hypothetical protein